MYRLKRTGKLAGWYGALAPGEKTVVSYNENQALVASSENRYVYIPLPPESELTEVTCLYHDGREETCDYEPAGENRIKLYVEDSGKDVLNYKIMYKLVCS